MSIMSSSSPGESREIRRIVGRVAGRAEVTSVMARHAVRSASLALATQAEVRILKYEEEMPLEAAVEWFVRNRQCIWRIGDS